ncbi:hypothetical protein LCGC14_0223390 [marine sediment metagenome]|uniref:Uncharacterized protein n=1 Tax=marine sediment metagenome TaxID=412755 RepID=A0A0F9WWG7_9ZZZZ
MDKEHKTILLGIVASGVIAPTIAIIVTYIIKKIEEKSKKR